MSMDLIQYVLLFIILLFVIRTTNSLRKKKIHVADFLLWLIFWALVAAIVIWPQSTQYTAEFLGIGRGADLVVYIGMLGLYFFFYQIVLKVKQLDHKITKLGRAVAVKDAKDLTEKDSDNE